MQKKGGGGRRDSAGLVSVLFYGKAGRPRTRKKKRPIAISYTSAKLGEGKKLSLIGLTLQIAKEKGEGTSRISRSVWGGKKGGEKKKKRDLRPPFEKFERRARKYAEHARRKRKGRTRCEQEDGKRKKKGGRNSVT